jgi:predicted ATP-grasp superfamily ATP-dependent carboligase
MRNLGRQGIDVYCVTDKKDYANSSKYCKGYFVVPGVETDLQKLRNFLVKSKLSETGKAVLFPTTDMSVLNLSSLIGEVDNYLAPISKQEVIETLVKKRKFYQSLVDVNVPHPITLFTDAPEDLKNIDKKIAFPVFVKPSVSQTFYRRFGTKGFVVDTKEKLYRTLRLMDKEDIEVTIQEIVAGPPTNHYFVDGYLDAKSRLVAIFARRRLRMWPLAFGNSTVCVSVPISEVEDMKDTVVRYLVSIGFHGIFSAEFKRDSHDHIGKLLEVNARSWWYNTFPSSCGVNIILAAYLESIGKEIVNPEDYPIGKYMVYFSDVKSSLMMLLQKELSLRQWATPLTSVRDWVVFAKDDPNPFSMNIPRTLKEIIKQRKKVVAATSQKSRQQS